MAFSWKVYNTIETGAKNGQAISTASTFINAVWVRFGHFTFTDCSLLSVVFPLLAVSLNELLAYRIIIIEVLEENTDIFQIDSYL